MIFNNNIELILTKICFAVLLNQKLVVEVSALSVSDICEYVDKQQIYCNCDKQGVDEARLVTCFILDTDGLSRSSPVWNGFKLQKNITSLMFTTRFDNKLTFLPVSAIKNIADSLDTLNINEMKLGHLETNSIKNFPKLSKITLESNDIRSLSDSSFVNLPALKSLSLSSNSIEILKSGVFIDLPKLEELFLDRNRLKTIEDNAFSQLKSVSEIDLRLNEINAISSSTFGGLTALKRLDLSRNQLKTIPRNAFTGAPLLRELDLNKNQIETIDENAFQNMSHLMSIQLNENKIQYLSTQVLKGCPNLVLVDLSANLLETIESELIIDLKHLKEEQFVFYLRDNRLQCDCRLFWLRNITQHTFGMLFRREFKHYKCVFNKELNDFKIGDEFKIQELVKTDSFVNSCDSGGQTVSQSISQSITQSSAEIEDTLDVENVSPVNGIIEEKANQMNLNQSTTETMNGNKIDSDNKQKESQNKKQLIQSFTETSTKVTEKLTNDLIEEKNTKDDTGIIKASQERTGGKDSDSCINCNKNTVFSLIFILYVFCKNQFVL